MAEALARPVRNIVDRLVGGGPVEPTEEMFAANDPQHLDVDDVGCRVVGVLGEALASGLGPGVPIRTSQRHEASTTSTGPAPPMLVERGGNLGASDRRRAPPGALEPGLQARSRREPGDLGP